MITIFRNRGHRIRNLILIVLLGTARSWGLVRQRTRNVHNLFSMPFRRQALRRIRSNKRQDINHGRITNRRTLTNHTRVTPALTRGISRPLGTRGNHVPFVRVTSNKGLVRLLRDARAAGPRGSFLASTRLFVTTMGNVNSTLVNKDIFRGVTVRRRRLGPASGNFPRLTNRHTV